MTWRFTIDAIVDPQSLARVVDCFALRAIVPVTTDMRVSGDRMRIEIVVADLAAQQAAIIAAKLGEAVVVFDVRLCQLADANA